MGRPRRHNDSGAWFHVVNRGVARQPIFFEDRDRVEFERLWSDAHDRFGVNVHAFCWMTNHYHVLLECPDGQLSEAMHLVGSVYARHVNERQGRDGPLFRDRFYARQVRSDAYVMRLVRYIHRNPLAFTSVDGLRTYRWSSHRIYLGRRRTPPWMQLDTVRSLFGGTAGLDQFVTGEAHRGMGRYDADTWWAAIDLALDERVGRDAKQGVARTVAMLVADRLTGVRRDEVIALLGFGTRQAESAARHRARRRVATSPELGLVADLVLDLLE